MPAVHVDGMNVLAVQDAARTAVARARSGGGPTFIEAPVYRFRAHGGSGDDSATGYRAEEERRAWESICPIAMFGQHLMQGGVLDKAAVEAMEGHIAGEIVEAFDFALASPNPMERDLYRHVYAE